MISHRVLNSQRAPLQPISRADICVFTLWELTRTGTLQVKDPENKASMVHPVLHLSSKEKQKKTRHIYWTRASSSFFQLKEWLLNNIFSIYSAPRKWWHTCLGAKAMPVTHRGKSTTDFDRDEVLLCLPTQCDTFLCTSTACVRSVGDDEHQG